MPAGVLAAVATVRVELEPELIGFGLKLPVAPEGSPLIDSVTDCDEPLVIVVEMVEVPLEPWVSVSVFGLALMEKSFGGTALTTRVTLVLWVTLPPVPVTVSV